MNWQRRRRSFWLGFLLLVCTSSLATAQDLGRYYALVIGNGDYRYFAPVPTAHHEAKELARILAGRYGFEVETILNAERKTILEALSRMSERIEKDRDSLLVYYAGHSIQDRYRGFNAWLPVDAEPDLDLDWISTALVSNLLRGTQAKHILVITESCYSNRLQELAAPRRPEPPAEQLQRLLENPSFTSLSLACDAPRRPFASFARTLLEVLQTNQHVLPGTLLASRMGGSLQYGSLVAREHKQGDFLFIPKHLHSKSSSPEQGTAQVRVQQAPAPRQSQVSTPAPSPTKSVAPRPSAASPGSQPPVQPKKGDVMIHKATGMEFVYVPEGCFTMGALADDPDSFDWEHPAHEVCVAGFWMGKHEVSQGQWKALMRNNPSGYQFSDQHPVENVSWHDVQAFLVEMNRRSQRRYRLPTEAEWEYACRGGGPGKYCGGDILDAVAWYEGNSGGRTQRVGSKRPNGFGLYDMSGNVWEWCADRFSENYYEISVRHNPQGPQSGQQRVVRGGSLGSSAANSRASFRFRNDPDYREDWLGFRVVMEH